MNTLNHHRHITTSTRLFTGMLLAGTVVACLNSVEAHAFSSGRFGSSGQNPANTCKQCHGNNAPAPSIEVTGLDGNLVAGGSVSFTLTVTSNLQNNQNRSAGVGASTDGAGLFTVVAGSGTKANGARTELTHSARRAMNAGVATFPMQLDGLVEGQHTLFIAGNDVNGSGSNGDNVGLATFSFTVSPAGEVDAGPDEDAGEVDAGPVVDAGEDPIVDAGEEPEEDAGEEPEPEEDAGEEPEPEEDAGALPVDAGNGDADAGDADAGTPPPSGGICASTEGVHVAPFGLMGALALLRWRRRR